MEWATVEPILRRVYTLMEDSGRTAGAAVVDDLEIGQDAARRVLDELARNGYITVEHYNGAGLPIFILPAEKGLQHCSGWPTPGTSPAFMSEFLRAIEARADDPATPEEQRGRLRQFLTAARAVGQDLLTDIVAKLVEHKTGL